MPLELTIKPKLMQTINSIETTNLQITVDLCDFLDLLKKSDLLLKVTLTATFFINGKEKKYLYEFSQIYKDISEPIITFKTMVLGNIRSTHYISGLAEGVLISKNRRR